MTTITITLPWPDKKLSPNFKLHHMQIHRLRKAYKETVIKCCQHQELHKVKFKPDAIVTGLVSWHPTVNRAYDDDNFAGRFKSGRDAIAHVIGVDDKHFRFQHVLAPKATTQFIIVILSQEQAIAA